LVGRPPSQAVSADQGRLVLRAAVREEPPRTCAAETKKISGFGSAFEWEWILGEKSPEIGR